MHIGWQSILIPSSFFHGLSGFKSHFSRKLARKLLSLKACSQCFMFNYEHFEITCNSHHFQCIYFNFRENFMVILFFNFSKMMRKKNNIKLWASICRRCLWQMKLRENRAHMLYINRIDGCSCCCFYLCNELFETSS